MLKAVVFNLGCKVNQYECDVLVSELENRGYHTSQELEYADLYVINTCAVTNEAERKSRQIISRIKKFNPNAKIIITGCASQKNKEFYLNKEVLYVSGVGGKQRIFEEIDKQLAEGKFDLPLSYEEPLAFPKPERTRSYVKIQDGCNNFCSYCIIPYLRGRSRSRKIDSCVKEIETLSKKTKEIVITGVNLAQYGVDNNESLAKLIDRLSNIDVRIRLGSFYVEGITDELLIALKGLKKFCPHFHLSLQHGDESVLKSMNRRYGPAEYKEKVDLIRKYFPLAAITTDIIVGFPTESEEAFENTLKFVEEVRFSDVHIFPFSPRPGTKAYSLPVISANVIKERKERLRIVKEKLNKEYLILMLNSYQDVIFETYVDGYSVGYSQYYVRIYTKTNKNNAVVKPTSLYKDGIIGEIKDDE
ncbi:MAG: tRNA (N(6)-L-threonylcarbamoyladenosine(37)-C(2))-methylthiotransferase MtaB [Clostridia bacterium]|nr:tRNA (N(6)-L-threonylcarbamoyladenosine(37)-C(2))-methylthiotransferase MtaB [Clostridia bacterium]